MSAAVTTGDQVELDVGPVAHGGHCVARLDGRVVFVRHALPGERVLATITEGGPDARFLRADAVEVRVASPDRVEPPCPYAGPGLCGGCDWQHATVDAQRRLKAEVIMEQLHRLGGIDREVVVQPLPGDDDGLGWRTRLQLAVGPDHRPGLRRHRSHEVIPIDRCLIAHPAVDETGVLRRRWRGRTTVEVIIGAEGPPLVLADGQTESGRTGRRAGVTEVAIGRRWRVSGSGFWQVHPAAADTLVAAVLRMLGPQRGEHALDLYSGVGLFSAALALELGDSGSVVAVESGLDAVGDARRNLHDLPTVRLVEAQVEQWLRRPGLSRADVVVLDPPRSGARRRVATDVAALRPRAIAYVACDPAALARDLAYFRDEGYQLADLEAYDLFPMTHHVECVALLVRAQPAAATARR